MAENTPQNKNPPIVRVMADNIYQWLEKGGQPSPAMPEFEVNLLETNGLVEKFLGEGEEYREVWSEVAEVYIRASIAGATRTGASHKRMLIWGLSGDRDKVLAFADRYVYKNALTESFKEGQVLYGLALADRARWENLAHLCELYYSTRKEDTLKELAETSLIEAHKWEILRNPEDLSVIMRNKIKQGFYSEGAKIHV